MNGRYTAQTNEILQPIGGILVVVIVHFVMALLDLFLQLFESFTIDITECFCFGNLCFSRSSNCFSHRKEKAENLTESQTQSHSTDKENRVLSA